MDLSLIADAPAASGRRTKPPRISTLQQKKLIPFGWYGGKFSHLDWLLPLLPPAHHYCEPFAGSGAVLLNREPSPVETYNDLAVEVVNFFRVLREQKEALTEAIGLTPFSREEFGLACTLEPGLPSLERARRFYVRARQVRTGLAQTATIGRWANCKDTSRAGMSGVVSRWLGGVGALPQIAERLLRVQIENRPASLIISTSLGGLPNRTQAAPEKSSRKHVWAGKSSMTYFRSRDLPPTHLKGLLIA